MFSFIVNFYNFLNTPDHQFRKCPPTIMSMKVLYVFSSFIFANSVFGNNYCYKAIAIDL